MPRWSMALMLQTGIVTKEGIYNLVKDIITSQGQDPHKYINPPSADSDKARLTAEDALAEHPRGRHDARWDATRGHPGSHAEVPEALAECG